MIASELRPTKETGIYIQSNLIKEDRANTQPSNDISQNSHGFSAAYNQELSLDIDCDLLDTHYLLRGNPNESVKFNENINLNAETIKSDKMMFKLKELRTQHEIPPKKESDQDQQVPKTTKESVISSFNIFKYSSPKFSEKIPAKPNSVNQHQPAIS